MWATKAHSHVKQQAKYNTIKIDEGKTVVNFVMCIPCIANCITQYPTPTDTPTATRSATQSADTADKQDATYRDGSKELMFVEQRTNRDRRQQTHNYTNILQYILNIVCLNPLPANVENTVSSQ
jgi:hypothetical protein